MLISSLCEVLYDKFTLTEFWPHSRKAASSQLQTEHTLLQQSAMMTLVAPLCFQCISFCFDLHKVEEHLETEEDSTAKYSCNSTLFCISKEPWQQNPHHNCISICTVCAKCGQQDAMVFTVPFCLTTNVWPVKLRGKIASFFFLSTFLIFISFLPYCFPIHYTCSSYHHSSLLSFTLKHFLHPHSSIPVSPLPMS